MLFFICDHILNYRDTTYADKDSKALIFFYDQGHCLRHMSF